MKIADRMTTIGTEGAFEISARARALEATGRSIIHLQVGEPDFDTPANVREAAKRALDAGETHYAPFMGVMALREAIAEDVTRRKSFPADPANVIVGVGGKMIMFWTSFCLLQPGDEAIVPDPGYPIYESSARLAGAKAVPLPVREERQFRLDLDELRSLVTDRTRLLVVNTPANPTGGVLTRADLAAIAELAVERDLWVLSDEIYSRIIYEGQHISLATFPGMAERTILLDGFSKAFAMTGWRLGYGVLPPALVGPFGKLAINSISNAATFNQIGAIEALRGPQEAVEAMVAEFRARRDLIVDGLNAIPGIRCHRPSGSFYVFPNVAGTGLRGADLYERLLTEAGVCVLPGTAFGDLATDFIRISYANSRENLAEALRRIDAFVRALPGVRAAAGA